MSEVPPLTILLGPVTSVSLALNTLARTNWRILRNAGVTVHTNRPASMLLRRHLGSEPAEARALGFQQETAKRPAFLSALNFFGPPQAGLIKGEMFPDAELALAGLVDIAPVARYVICIDTLPAFFLAAGSDALEARAHRTSWEALYALSWADLAREIKAALPASDLVVLTPDGTGRRSVGILKHLFGEAAVALPDAHALLRARVGETGQAVLDRLLAEGTPSPEMLDEFQASFAVRATRADLKDRLGLDKVTTALLEQRFLEDLDVLHGLPGTEVI